MSRVRGFTLIELTVVICVVALLFGVALDRLERYYELGERAVVEQNLAAVNVALTMKFASLVIAGRAGAIEADVGTNPVKLLARPPENYLGELYSPDPGSLERRSWYYDLQSGELIYVPSRARYLSFSPGSAGRLRFRILLTDVGTEPGAPREFRQPFIGPVVPYQWVIQ